MGFAEQLHKISTQLSETHQTLLFSAAMPSALEQFSWAGLRDPQFVRLDMGRSISPCCKLTFFTFRSEEKIAALVYLIREVINPNEQLLVFVSTKHHTEFLKLLLSLEGIESDICYVDMDPEARKIRRSKFRSGKTRMLNVTDVACRGMDIPLLNNVINWDYPPKSKIFVHRVVRVARNGRSGTAYSFVTSEDLPYFLDLHLFLSKPFRAAPIEEEFSKDIDGVKAKINQAIPKGETVYGRFSHTHLGLVQDKLRDVMDSCSDLAALEKTSITAYREYSRWKPFPSKESIRRVMSDLPRAGYLYPMYL